MSQNIRSLAERTAQQKQVRATVDVDQRESTSFVLPGIVTVSSGGGVYTVAVVEQDGQASTTNVYTNIFSLLPGGEFAVNDSVALLFQPGESTPAIFATGGGGISGDAVYVVFGGLGFAS